MASQTQDFWRDGYAICRAVFSATEVARWRKRALSIGSVESDLMSDEMLREVVLDPRLITRAAEILGSTPVYFGDSTASIGGPMIGGFHKDCSDRYDGNAPDWQVSKYPMLRFGIYCQNHHGLPAGLDLRSGSHNHPDTTSGSWHTADTRAGDLVVWNGRTTHSGPSTMIGRYRVEPNGMVWHALARSRLLQRFLRSHPEKRVALFTTYSIEHPLLDRHLQYLKSRTYAVRKWRSSYWAADTVSQAQRRGLNVISPEEALRGVAETHEDYKQLAY